MLRKMTIGCVVTVAMLAAPVTLPAHAMDHFHHFRHPTTSLIFITSGTTTSLTFITSDTTTSLCADPDRNTSAL